MNLYRIFDITLNIECNDTLYLLMFVCHLFFYHLFMDVGILVMLFSCVLTTDGINLNHIELHI